MYKVGDYARLRGVGVVKIVGMQVTKRLPPSGDYWETIGYWYEIDGLQFYAQDYFLAPVVRVGDKIKITKYQCGAPTGAVVEVTRVNGNSVEYNYDNVGYYCATFDHFEVE